MNRQRSPSRSSFSLMGSPSWPWSLFSSTTVSLNEIETPSPSTVFLHEKLTRRQVDRYILGLALVMIKLGFRVAIWTTQFNEGRSIEVMDFKDWIDLEVCGEWIPPTIFGYYKSIMSYFRAIFLTLKLIFVIKIKTPRHLRPKIVFHDLNSTVNVLLKMFTECKVFYIRNFAAHIGMELTPYDYIRRISVIQDQYDLPTLMEKMTINFPDHIIVQANAFGEIIRAYCHPLHKKVTTLHPAVDIGLFRTTRYAPLKNILFDPEPNLHILLSIGKYTAATNFELVLDSFYEFMKIMKKERCQHKFRLIIGSYTCTQEEGLYYKQLRTHILQNWRYASNVSSLRVLPQVHEKTLLKLAKVTIHACVQDVFSEFLLKSMYMGKIIIGTKTGLASKLLVHHFNGLMVKANPRDFAMMYREVINNPNLSHSFGCNVKELFNENYSFTALTRNIKEMLESEQLEINEMEYAGSKGKALGDVGSSSEEMEDQESLTNESSSGDDEQSNDLDDTSCSCSCTLSTSDDTLTS